MLKLRLTPINGRFFVRGSFCLTFVVEAKELFVKFLLTATSGAKPIEVMFVVRFLNAQPCEDVTPGYVAGSDTRRGSPVGEMPKGR